MKEAEHAEQARKEHAEFLRDAGAHAISVEEVSIKGRKEFAVVAAFDKKPKAKLPSSLKVRAGTKSVDVPLVARRQARFQLE